MFRPEPRSGDFAKNLARLRLRLFLPRSVSLAEAEALSFKLASLSFFLARVSRDRRSAFITNHYFMRFLQERQPALTYSHYSGYILLAFD
jgi:hypothetical protein